MERQLMSFNIKDEIVYLRKCIEAMPPWTQDKEWQKLKNLALVVMRQNVKMAGMIGDFRVSNESIVNVMILDKIELFQILRTDFARSHELPGIDSDREYFRKLVNEWRTPIGVV